MGNFVTDLYSKLYIATQALEQIERKGKLSLSKEQYRYELQSAIDTAKTALIKIEEVSNE